MRPTRQLGLRVKKATAVGTTLFSHDLAGHVLAESTGGGGTPVEYVYANGVPVAQFRGADAYYYHVDHLGVPSVMTDGSRREVWRSGDLPYGDAAPTGTAVSNLRFPGQYFDAESGLPFVSLYGDKTKPTAEDLRGRRVRSRLRTPDGYSFTVVSALAMSAMIWSSDPTPASSRFFWSRDAGDCQ